MWYDQLTPVSFFESEEVKQANREVMAWRRIAQDAEAEAARWKKRATQIRRETIEELIAESEGSTMSWDELLYMPDSDEGYNSVSEWLRSRLESLDATDTNG